MLQLSHFCWKNLRKQQVIAGFPCTMGPNNGRPTIRAWTPTSMVPQRFWFRNLVRKIQLAHLWIGILLKWCEIKENVVTGKSIFVWKFVLMDLNFSNLKYFCQISQKPLQFCWANFFSVFFFFAVFTQYICQNLSYFQSKDQTKYFTFIWNVTGNNFPFFEVHGRQSSHVFKR